MKKLISLLVIIILVAFTDNQAKPRYSSVSIGMFYSSLSPYGEWIEFDAGIIGWRPNSVHSYWRPYSIGRWSWTKYGWYWDSYEPFGWATYHYGRWYYDEYYGWIWIPDNVWGPSWVEWRYDDDYIGWAPLPPYAEFRFGIGIHFSIRWNSHHSYWNFVTFSRFNSHRLHYYILDHSRNYKIFSRTKYRNNYYSDRDRVINGGIDRDFVERRGGYRIGERDVYDLNDYEKYDRSRKSGGERIYSYRPEEREIEKNRDISKMEIKRSDRRLLIENENLAGTERKARDTEIRNEGVGEKREVFGNDRIQNGRAGERESAKDTPFRKTVPEERKEDIKKSEERREINRENIFRNESSRNSKEIVPQREVRREVESKNSRNENVSRSIERPEKRTESRERKSEERRSDRGNSERRR